MEILFNQVTVESNLNLNNLPEFELPTEGIAKDVILDVLISRQYKNPLHASIREALQNAFDANIEAGNEHRGVQITLPTWGEPTFSIRDFGLGINRERFDQVYRKIGESTKRGNNLQSGGFGIGRLSALAVSDHVAVTSVVNRVKYSHVLIKRGDGKYNFVTIDESETEEVNGTTVSFSVAESLKGTHPAEKAGKIKEFVTELTWWATQPVWIKEFLITEEEEGVKESYYGLNKVAQKEKDQDLVVERGSFSYEGKEYHWEYNCDGYLGKIECSFVVGNLTYPLDYFKSKFLERRQILRQYGSDSLYALHNDYCFSTEYLNGRRSFWQGRKLVIYTTPGDLKLTSNRENFLDDEENNEKLNHLLSKAADEFLFTAGNRLRAQNSLKGAIHSFHRLYPIDYSKYKGKDLTKENLSFNNHSQVSDFKDWYLFVPDGEIQKDEKAAIQSDLTILSNCGFRVSDRCSDKSCLSFDLFHRRGRRNRVQIPLIHFLKFQWVVCHRGFSLAKVRKAPQVPKDKALLVIQLPLSTDETLQEQVSKHRLLGLANPDELIILNPEKKKSVSTKKVTYVEEDIDVEISKLVTQGRARILTSNWRHVSKNSIYEKTETIPVLPSKGVYVVTSPSMNYFSEEFLPPSLKADDLIFVPSSLASLLAEDKENWVSLKTYSANYFDALVTQYEKALQLLNYQIDPVWAAPSNRLGTRQSAEALSLILSTATRVHQKVEGIDNLIALLLKPSELSWLAMITSAEGEAYINYEFGSKDSAEQRKKLRDCINQTKKWGFGSRYHDSLCVPIFAALYREYPMLLYSLGQFSYHEFGYHDFGQYDPMYGYTEEQRAKAREAHAKILDVLIDYINLINGQTD